ncbi:hypothetical protein NXC14_PA00219 (plasmid) [Rhizobium sp. NXC14]|nr:hypothetical protein NXC14_PA00219 [Rhizobium sp. NXC14]
MTLRDNRAALERDRAADQRRRRSTEVMTSIGMLRHKLLLAFALGLPMFASTSQGGLRRLAITHI